MTRKAETDYDVIIAGGGMVGASLAISLAIEKVNPLKILLVEGLELPIDTAQNPQYQPSFDARCTALSYSSRSYFEQIGVWSALSKHVQPIRKIHVSDRGRFGSVLMDCEQEKLEALGFVVENHWLGKILLHEVSKLEHVSLMCPATVTEFQPDRNKVSVVVQGKKEQTLTSKLLVIADGANSGLRKQLGIDCEQQAYGQTAIISNVSHARPHQGKAFERFTEQGSVAFLPLVSSRDGEHRSALVWINDVDCAQELIGLPEQEFLDRLQQRFGYRLGRLGKIGQRFSYPLTRIQAREQYRTGVVVLGNAAHSLHPVAGQGFNLSLRDLARLSEELLNAHRQGSAIGSPALLQQYCQQQELDQEKTIVASGLLPDLFDNRQPALKLFSDAGLLLMDMLPNAKSALVRHATGLAEKESRLIR
jgi:2-polyprenyl-6-methoxyphenol 4-hydroxylase